MPKLDYSKEIRKAVREYWQSKSGALKKNQSGNKADTGNRGGATAGKNFDGFSNMLSKLAMKSGGKRLEVYENKNHVILPGHFRPSKQWDLVVMYESRLIAVIEFKALGGPSFGNNANNRCEEALGSGLDLNIAQREGLLGSGASPFVGYIILVEDQEGSRKEPKRGNPSPHFRSDPIFDKASYQQRMQILCERIIQERLYTAAAAIASPPNANQSGKYTELSKNTSLDRFIARFLAHIEIETSG